MMSQNNSNETIAIQKARGIIEKINAVEDLILLRLLWIIRI